MKRKLVAPTPIGMCLIPELGDRLETLGGKSAGFVWSIDGNQFETRSYTGHGKDGEYCAPNQRHFNISDIGRKVIVSVLNDAKGDEREVLA